MERCFVFLKCDFSLFFSLLAGFGKVHAPVPVSDQSYAYREVDQAEQIAFAALRTILPPKKYFYVQHESIIAFKGNDIQEVEPHHERFVLFGVHPCDLAGLDIMDSIYMAEPGDPHYIARRDAALIVGLSCMPDKHCFCQSMGTGSLSGNYDMFLTDIGDRFFLQVHTPLALALVQTQNHWLAEATDDDRQAFKQFWQARSEAFSNGFNAENLQAVTDMEWNNPVWEELGQRCLSCGNCTPVCPTCYCFDMVDIVQLEGDAGERVREWDSCQFAGFAQVAGGANFRPGPVDRLKFWYRHKLHGFDDPWGFKTCVGCGRCTVSCPAGIDDIVGTVLRLQGLEDKRT